MHPRGFDLTAQSGGTEVMVKVCVFAESFGIDELGGLSGSEGVRRAALAHIVEALPDLARVDLIGVCECEC